VWDTDHPWVAKHQKPVILSLKDPTTFINVSQYLLLPPILRGHKPIISPLLQAELLIPAHSPHNNPILGFCKSNDQHWLV
jgi:hypothetical protein